MKKQLLFIDDNPMMGGFLSHLFGKNYEVIWCSSVESALNSLNKNIPDLIICDYQLEDQTGFDFLKEIKSQMKFAEIPVLMLSGKGTSENRIKCLQQGAEDFIVKPFNPIELNIKVDNIIRKTIEN